LLSGLLWETLWGVMQSQQTSKKPSTSTSDPALKPLEQLLGAWTSEATHPVLPGVLVRGTARGEWLEGESFLILRTRMEHPDFPDAISIIGRMDRDRIHGAPSAAAISTAGGGAGLGLSLHYFDSRGVFRVFDTTIDPTTWQYSRLAPGFSQRFIGTFGDGGDTIVGVSQLCQDDTHWKDDLRITYKRER
jgi:hypothetical protein